MDLAHRLARMEADGTRLIEVAQRNLDAPVPTCPGWTAADLLDHAVDAWSAFAAQAEHLATEHLDWEALPRLTASEALAWCVAAVGAHDPETPLWTWSADQTLGFWQRRAHHETLLHRVDAERAANDVTPIPAADAIDGVDEFFTHLAAMTDVARPAGSLHLHQTDGDGEFLLEVVDGRIVMTHEHAKGDAALRAAGADLLLVVWGRRGLDGLELFGDADIALQWTKLAP